MYSSSEAPDLRPDRALVTLAVDGDTAAFGTLVGRHQGVVRAVALSATGSFAASEDVAQEAFVTAWKKLAGLRDPERFRSWVCGIARTLGRGVRRRRAIDPLVNAIPAEDVAFLAADSGSALDRAVTTEECAQLEAALGRIPEKYREPLVLFHIEGQSPAAVARALDVSVDAVHQRVSRARRMLRADLASVMNRALRRGRPEAAFTAAVIALIVSAPRAAGASVATAAGSMVKWGAVTIAVAAAGAVGTLWLTRTPSRPASAPSTLASAQSSPPERFADPGQEVARPRREGQRPAPPRLLTSSGVATSAGAAPVDMKSAIRSEMRERIIPAFKACYERLPSQHRQAGRLVARFTIVADGTAGRVRDASVEWTGPDEDASPLVGQCLTAALGDARFPPPQDGPETVSYPLSISQGRGNTPRPPADGGVAAADAVRTFVVNCAQHFPDDGLGPTAVRVSVNFDAGSGADGPRIEVDQVRMRGRVPGAAIECIRRQVAAFPWRRRSGLHEATVALDLRALNARTLPGAAAE